MAYPAAPDWNSAAPNSAWVIRNGHVCQTTGWNFLLDLQTQLRQRLSDSGSMQTFDGSSVTADDVNINETGNASGWDANLLRALYAVASRDRAPSDALQSIQSDAASLVISPRTLATAIWEADFSAGYTAAGAQVFGQGSVNEIQIPAGSSLPSFGYAPPVPAYGADSVGMDCHLVGTAAVTPVGQPGVVPFAINPWVILGVLALGVIGVNATVKQVPTSTKYYSRKRK